MVIAEATKNDILRHLFILLQTGSKKERGRDTTETVQVKIVAIAGIAAETEKIETEVDTETASTIATEIVMLASDPGSGTTEARTNPDPRMGLATPTLKERVNTTALRDRIQADRRQSQTKTATKRLPQDSLLFSPCPWYRHLSPSHW